MNRIIVSISKITNYIYHMLSVSKCGYDNEYGKKNSHIHKTADLDILKINDELLTVIGGKYFGRLYSVFVSTPAAIEEDNIFLHYLEGIKDLFLNNNPAYNYEKYKNTYKTAYSAHKFVVTEQSCFDFYNHLVDIKKSIIEICEVLINNYALYHEYVWKKSQQELESKVELLKKYFNTDIELEWENLTGHKYPFQKFEVLLCNSISGGAQAIDIAYNKDVFDSDMDTETIIQYISHEFGIFVLRDKLDQEKNIDFHSNYDIIESVVEYFNPIKYKNLVFGDKYNTVVERIKNVKSMEPSISMFEIINKIKN